jgi:chromosome segregation ATPase
MSELAPEPRPRRRSGLLIAIGLVAIVAIGASVVWMQSYRALSNTTTEADPPQAPEQTRQARIAQSPPQVAPSDDTLKSFDQLRQQVNDLDADRKDLSQQLDTTKRQLAETQGDLKLLSEQLGSLSERLDSLSASRASMPAGVDADQRKGAKSR